MKALIIHGPGKASVEEVPDATAGAGEVVVRVQQVGICGTDAEFFSGEMAYLASGHAEYPIRLGHEWMGIVTAVGQGVPGSWIGARVTGDTMLGCGECDRCLRGYQHVCEHRFELGVRGGKPGALAEAVSVPASSLHRLPDSVDDTMGALVEPGGNAFRAVEACGVLPGEKILVLGAGTIGLLAAMFARARGADVHLVGRSARSLEFARSLGFANVTTEADMPTHSWAAVIEASNSPDMPNKAIDWVDPGRRIAYVGLAGSPSMVDTRDLALKDVTAVGILSASPGLAGTIDAYASGSVDPRPLVAATVRLEDLPSVFHGTRPPGAGAGPKVHVRFG